MKKKYVDLLNELEECASSLQETAHRQAWRRLLAAASHRVVRLSLPVAGLGRHTGVKVCFCCDFLIISKVKTSADRNNNT